MHYNHPFDPVVFPNTVLLILGTFPSLESCKRHGYYAHPRNQFWRILSDLFHVPATTELEKTALLNKYRIGLWDIIASCERTDSSDSNLTNCHLNDIPALLQKYPQISHLAFTGKKAARLYQKTYADLHVNCQTLPSPSPAFATMKYNTKKEAYRRCFQHVGIL